MTIIRDRQSKYLAQTVALISTVLLSWTVTHGQPQTACGINLIYKMYDNGKPVTYYETYHQYNLPANTILLEKNPNSYLIDGGFGVPYPCSPYNEFVGTIFTYKKVPYDSPYGKAFNYGLVIDRQMNIHFDCIKPEYTYYLDSLGFEAGEFELAYSTDTTSYKWEGKNLRRVKLIKYHKDSLQKQIINQPQTPKELGQIIFEILKSQKLYPLYTHCIPKWDEVLENVKSKSPNITEDEIKTAAIKFREETELLGNRFANIKYDGANEGINWREIIMDSVQVSEYTFPTGENIQSKNVTETHITINFSYKKRKFDIVIRVFQYKDKWKISARASEILFSELITIPKKIGE